ncbi:hypothetical protein PV10_07532 [Exophiala mesophila]|uniref:Mediator of RNA polymerase II transcription subunit 20 n=1 Tax=Exophiala mesophila TaxID=212818 RepID=A0A0D1XQ14_EXOME|nr:uncharacterized protein PV10_07532 [Exophiala mesophila]KIV90201.1 hypothetical protein PV10_07532 [Exophiala mesophila]
MSITGLFFLPVLANQPSPSSSLISHISRSQTAQPLPAFFLDHRLFVDTSSLLPNADPSLRRFTSILALSHTSAIAYLGTSPPRDASKPPAAAAAADKEQQSQTSTPTIITIPSSATESFTQLVGTKLQPQWAHRQSLVVENGTSLSMNKGEWIVRIGDVKIPSRQNQAGPNLRGTLIEVSRGVDASTELKEGSLLTQEDELLIREFLASLIQETGVKLEQSRAMFRRIATGTGAGVGADVVRPLDQPDFALAALYMDMLRGSRG